MLVIVQEMTSVIFIGKCASEWVYAEVMYVGYRFQGFSCIGIILTNGCVQ